MRKRTGVRRAGRAIALVGILALALPAVAGGVDDPGFPVTCQGPTAASGCVEMAVVQPSPEPVPAPVARLLTWSWIVTWLLRH